MDRSCALLWLLSVVTFSSSQTVNRAPQFINGGDMARFSLPENSDVGAPVYRLRGTDPEGSTVHYSISGQHFEVDRISGIVTLVRALDRETLDILEVIISITDEPVGEAEPNTVSLRREIPVLDVNDNAPEFLGRPYSAVILESSKPGSSVFSNITVVDSDSAHNSEVTLKCLSGGCDTFSISTEKVGDGQYRGVVVLKKPLDYEMLSSYSLSIEASDLGDEPLKAVANVAISVIDVQDQPPVFLNAPFSATLQENTSPGYQVLKIEAKDGDLGEPRPVLLTIEGDTLGYFKLVKGTLVTTHVPIDRENPIIIQNGGVYSFRVKATELINNELPGDFSYETVTIVVTDMDDQVPLFNVPLFRINVPEDIAVGTPLPDLNMVVADSDIGENSKYHLELRARDKRVMNWFVVEPAEGYGRTPVVVRVQDNTGLDYDSGLRQLQFTIAAFVYTKQNEKLEVSSSDVIVNVIDSNDNSPIFGSPSYSFSIPENFPVGSIIANISATDIDSGPFGSVSYSLRGFGTNKFAIDPHNGSLYLINRVDYEKQKSFSLSLEAKDGGNRVTTVSLLVNLMDVNDNAPTWEMGQYQRTVREGATTFQPRFFTRALDPDKDGLSAISYKILTTNSDVLSVDRMTGEIKMLSPVSSSHTSRGQYELMIRAFDDGTPPLHADVPVLVRVGVPGNQRPVFRGAPYVANLLETARPGDEVIRVKATDPDGPDQAVQYRIANGADNFLIDQSSGAITVSPVAILDPDVTSIDRYSVTVLAIDSGSPVHETAQTMVIINIKDVNNKSPYFLPESNYVRHISEKSEIGKIVLTVKAIDQDKDMELKYSIESVRARHKTGVPISDGSGYDFKSAFKIDSKTGEISVASRLNHQLAASIILVIRAEDLNSATGPQTARTEVTFYIQAHDERNPQFTVGGWNSIEGVIRLSVQEERPVGSVLLTLTAVDPVDGSPIRKFTLLPPNPTVFSLEPNGNLRAVQRLDFETLTEKTITFHVAAHSSDNLRTRAAQVIVTVLNINDHSPEFTRSAYSAQLLESAPKGTPVLTIQAVDGDKNGTVDGFGDVVYSLTGENAALFHIDPISGNITVSGEGTIDRERQEMLRLSGVAQDTPMGGATQRKTTVPIIIELVDVNDNKPIFGSAEYTAVVLENVPKGTFVLTVDASDPDSGPSGQVEFEIVHQTEAAGLFVLNQTTGEIKTNLALTGKGRTEPYGITVRAQDAGSPSLFSDVPVRIYVGDVVANDGIPTFVHPTVDEMAYISENSSLGSPVFRVIATDPDDPNSLEGQIRFSFLQDASDSLAFNIDPISGLITTKRHLDREEKDKYQLILIAEDSGAVPQHATRQLTITVTDIDDNKPVFKRSLDEPPLELTVEEELPTGSMIGVVEAIDLDVGDNAKIDYLISYGNEDNLFSIHRLQNNSAALNVSGRIDRETAAEHLITVKCFKFSATPLSLRKIYNKKDLSERQIRIKVKDIDDNSPEFTKQNVTVGVRVNVPTDTLLHTINAVDEDVDAPAIKYHIESIQFYPPPTYIGTVNQTTESIVKLFSLDNVTGELRTAGSFADYNDGRFTMKISASNRNTTDGKAFTEINVFVVRERGLLKFIFAQPPGEVRAVLPEFKKQVEAILSPPVTMNVFDAQFLSKRDGSLDFSATSSCFQLFGAHSFDVKEMEKLMSPQSNPQMDAVYKKFGVQGVERCAPVLAKAEMSWVQIAILSIAVLIGVASFVSGCVLCCSHSPRRRR